jgi:hypothetical protein
METKYIVNNLSEQTIDGDVIINGNVTITGTTNTRPYKVYTALLTQSGGDDPLTLYSGAVTKGVTYKIKETTTGDFSNVGAPNNNVNTIFVAINDEVPNNYSGGGLSYNNGAPVVTVLENTIGNIWFTYSVGGEYLVNSDNLFTENKTAQFLNTDYTNDGYLIISNFNTNSAINLASLDSDGISTDGLFSSTPIEIRVYN